MKISKLLLAAAGIEAITLGAGAAVLGSCALLPLDVWVTGRIDLVNQIAQIWVLILIAGMLMTYVGLERRRAKTVFLSIGAVALLAYGGPVAKEYALRAGIELLAPKPGPNDLRVLQFNVLEINVQPIKAIASILRADADVVTIQEPHPAVRNSPQIRAKYPYHVQSYRADCAVGCQLLILSKRPISASKDEILPGLSAKPHPPGTEGDLQILWADTLGPDGKAVRILTTHISWPIPPAPHRLQRLALTRYLKTQDLKNLVLTGDFNSAPWSWDIRWLDGSVKPLSRRTRAVYSWMAYFPRVWQPTSLTFLAIDHLYAGPAWKTIALERRKRAGSDHYPVLVTLRRVDG